MKPWQRLLVLLRIKPGAETRSFELDEPMQVALVEQADQDSLPVEQDQAELLRAGLNKMFSADELKFCWESLSVREQDVTALTCLKYTNRQMAARLQISPYTVKSYLGRTLIKWQVHGKDELRVLLANWDFSAWERPKK